MFRTRLIVVRNKWLGSMDLVRIFSIGFNLAFSCTLQIILGFILCWLFNNNFIYSFNSMYCFIFEYEFGSIIRSFHISMTSFIYILLYIHIVKVTYLALVFDSSLLVWTIGFLLWFHIIIIAFIGYVLPLNSISYWGLIVLSNIISTIPYIGNLVVNWLWGCEFINEITLVKMHTLHIVIPLEMILIILLHLVCLHYFISSDSADRFAFYIERFDWFYYRDLLLWLILFIVLNYYVFIYWFIVMHEEYFIEVNVLKTPEKVIPEWVVGIKAPSKGWCGVGVRTDVTWVLFVKIGLRSWVWGLWSKWQWGWGDLFVTVCNLLPVSMEFLYHRIEKS